MKNKLQQIFDLQEEFEHYLNNKVGQIDVPVKAPTHKHVIEAIYYFQCMNIEFYEFLNSSSKQEMKDELIDVLIFAVDVFLFLGVKSKHITYDLDYYMDKSKEVTEHIIKDSCYNNTLITAILGKHKSIAEDFITHTLATLNVVFSKLMYSSVAYKKWKTYDESVGVVRDIEELDKAMHDVFKVICMLFKVLDADADQVFEMFCSKRKVNQDRQVEGYSEV